MRKTTKPHRRDFLTAAAAGTAASMLTGLARAETPEPSGGPVPMLHVTDLYRPYNDPDDHWDLACAYALAWRGEAELAGIFIDYPKPERQYDPDVIAVAQMNYLTGKTAPVLVGSPRWIEPQEATDEANGPAMRGILAMLDILRRSPRPVVINILGSCRDVAMAGRLEPELFARRCAAVYLNAGSGTPDVEKAAKLEWNVGLDPRAYASIFDLPCPVYWMPCFQEVHPKSEDLFREAEYATFYRFRQGEVLPHLSDGVRNYFAYMFMHGRGAMKDRPGETPRLDWLRYLVGPTDPAWQARIDAMDRNMWCTAGFLHAVGKTVTRDGQVVPRTDARDAVCGFDPIRVTCSPAGVTQWQSGSQSPERFIFHVYDRERYAAAMTSALKSLLSELP